MARRVFFSFHYKPDNWRVSKIRSIGSLEGNRPVTDNNWESIVKGGDIGIKRWINEQMEGKSCLLVLIGSNTANRKWINYEIIHAWDNHKGVLGINIHNIKDVNLQQSEKGANPFDYINFEGTSTKLSSIVRTYDPPYSTSEFVYNHIRDNLSNWVEEAIRIRDCYR